MDSAQMLGENPTNFSVMSSRITFQTERLMKSRVPTTTVDSKTKRCNWFSQPGHRREKATLGTAAPTKNKYPSCSRRSVFDGG
ncbi:hypothetical protein TNIN_237311, partial [Trichonephila inaurata madagascariensis]